MVLALFMNEHAKPAAAHTRNPCGGPAPADHDAKPSTSFPPNDRPAPPCRFLLEDLAHDSDFVLGADDTGHLIAALEWAGMIEPRCDELARIAAACFEIRFVGVDRS